MTTNNLKGHPTLQELDNRIRQARTMRKWALRNLPALPQPKDLYSYLGASTFFMDLPTPAFTAEGSPGLYHLLEAIAELPDCLDMESRDYPGLSKREYTFRFPLISVCVSANLIESTACKRVIVGERTTTRLVTVEVTEPVYAFDCDPAPTPASAPVPTPGAAA